MYDDQIDPDPTREEQLEAFLREKDAEIERLRAAVSQYAEHRNWSLKCPYIWKPTLNGWRIAEEALK